MSSMTTTGSAKIAKKNQPRSNQRAKHEAMDESDEKNVLGIDEGKLRKKFEDSVSLIVNCIKLRIENI